LLTPGEYELTVSADGYEPVVQQVVITHTPETEAQHLDFYLPPQEMEEAVSQNFTNFSILSLINIFMINMDIISTQSRTHSLIKFKDRQKIQVKVLFWFLYNFNGTGKVTLFFTHFSHLYF
jgi:hypothetical protein